MQAWPFIFLFAAVSAFPASNEQAPPGLEWLFKNNNSNEDDCDNDIDISDNSQNTCQTRQCRTMSRYILDGLNEEANPCENFYDYACGSWSTNHPLESHENIKDTTDVMMKFMNKRIRDILKEDYKSHDTGPLKMAKKWYRSCINTDLIENVGFDRIQNILNETGGWPIIMQKSELKSWNQTWQKIDNVYGWLFDEHAFYRLEVGKEETDSGNRYLFEILQDISYTLRDLNPRTKNFKLESVEANAIAEVALEFARRRGSNVTRKTIALEAQKIYDFEQALKALTSKEREQDKLGSGSLMTIEKFQKWYDRLKTSNSKTKINWLETLNYFLEDVDVRVHETSYIGVYDKYIIRRMQRLLAKTPLTVIVNYVQWRMVAKLLPYTNRNMRELSLKIQTGDENATEKIPRWETCVKNLQIIHPVANKFVEKYYSDEAAKKVDKMVGELKETYVSRLANSSWLSSQTKKKLIQKIQNLKQNVVYPNWYKNETLMNEFYAGLSINHKYIDNAVSYMRFAANKKYSALKDNYQGESGWSDAYPTTDNAFYMVQDNAITIPAAIMPYPLLESSLPDAVLYGSVGASTLGHEIGHSLDDTGIQFGKNGSEIVWISKDVRKVYPEKTECFVDQYNDFVVPTSEDSDDVTVVNGQKTLGDNIADTVGLQIAFSVFQEKLNDVNHVSLKLPGLEKFTDEQLFFLSFANSWCTTLLPYIEDYYATKDGHAPPRFRVIGPVSNLDGFAKAFQCSENSEMNPDEKCDLWK